jgi:hypothetical protein
MSTCINISRQKWNNVAHSTRQSFHDKNCMYFFTNVFHVIKFIPPWWCHFIYSQSFKNMKHAKFLNKFCKLWFKLLRITLNWWHKFLFYYMLRNLYISHVWIFLFCIFYVFFLNKYKMFIQSLELINMVYILSTMKIINSCKICLEVSFPNLSFL